MNPTDKTFLIEEFKNIVIKSLLDGRFTPTTLTSDVAEVVKIVEQTIRSYPMKPLSQVEK